MAIVKMKRLRLIALNSQKEDLLARLLHLGCVELSEPVEQMSDPEWTALLHRSESNLSDVRQDLARATAALQTLDRYAPVKSGLFKTREVLKEADFLSEETLNKNMANAEQINNREKELTELQAQETRVSTGLGAMRPWTGLDVDLNVRSTANVKVALCVCPAAVDMGALAKDLAEAAPLAQIIESSTDVDQHYFLLLCHKSQVEAADEVLKGCGVAPAGLKDVTGTASANVIALEAEMEQINARRETLLAEIAGFGEARQGLKVCIDRLRQEVAKAEVAQRAVTDDTILYYSGWVVAEKLAEVEAELAQFTCAWETEDPAEEDFSEVPVTLKNNKFTRSLSMVTDMYSLPAYNGVDPNPLMAFFFIFFYGFMMADMGYGIVMMLLSFIIMKKSKPKGPTMRHMIPLMGWCGISTFIMGAITGGFFGDMIPQLVLMTTGKEIALPSLFSPLDDALAVLIGSLVIGVVQIFTGMGVSVYMKVKRGQVMDAICNEVAWFLVFVLFGLGAVIGQLKIAGIAIGILLILTQSYGKKGIVGKLMGIGGSLYNNITGYFSDILSYSRLMALMLAGAVIAQVFNTLGGITGNVITFFIISIIGNVLNFALNILGCYVHDMRLQCLEFFGRFYEDGGKPFRPLEINTQYIDVVND